MASPLHPYGDYGTALRNLRGARNTLGYLLFLCVLLQIVGFFLMRFTIQPYVASRVVATAPRQAPVTASRSDQVQSGVSIQLPETNAAPYATSENTGPVENFVGGEWMRHAPVGRKLNFRSQWAITYYVLIPVTQLLGLLSAASQAIIIFICLLVVLVAQAPGVAHLSRSLIWSVILVFLVLPWQYVLPQFPIPGILYGWRELLATLTISFLPPPGHGITFAQRALIVARYVLWPVVGLIVMLVTAERFRAGTRLAIGHPLQSMMLGTSGGPGSPGSPAGYSSPVPPPAGMPSSLSSTGATIRPGVKI